MKISLSKLSKQFFSFFIICFSCINFIFEVTKMNSFVIRANQGAPRSGFFSKVNSFINRCTFIFTLFRVLLILSVGCFSQITQTIIISNSINMIKHIWLGSILKKPTYSMDKVMFSLNITLNIIFSIIKTYFCRFNGFMNSVQKSSIFIIEKVISQIYFEIGCEKFIFTHIRKLNINNILSMAGKDKEYCYGV